MADGVLYPYAPYANARARLDEYREKTKAQATQAGARDAMTETLYVAEVAGAGFAASLLSGTGGPDGRTVFGLPVEIVLGTVIGGAGVLLLTRGDSAPAKGGANTQDLAGHLLAVGSGTLAAYTSRLGFQAGLSRAKPPAEEQANASQVSGAPPATQPPTAICYVPVPPQWMLPPPQTAAPVMVPAGSLAASAQQHEIVAPIAVHEGPSVGADEIETAAEILERLNRR